MVFPGSVLAELQALSSSLKHNHINETSYQNLKCGEKCLFPVLKNSFNKKFLKIHNESLFSQLVLHFVTLWS